MTKDSPVAPAHVHSADTCATMSMLALAVAVLLCVRPVPLAAQRTSADTVHTRLGAVYALADRNNPRIAAAAALADAVRARASGARRPPDPQLQLGLMNRELPGLAEMDPLGMTQVQLMQMLPTPGKLGFAGEAADARATAARERATEMRWEIRRLVAAAFYDVYRTERALTIALATRRLVEDVAATADAMYRVGETAQADVLKARVAVARMDEEIIAMRAMRLAQLARLTGLLDQPIDSTMPRVALPVFPDSVGAIDSLTRHAADDRPMVRAGQAELAAAESDSRLARREIWPDLQLGVQYGQRGGMGGVERMASLMVGASLPVFAGSRQLRMRDEAEAMRAMTAADLGAMRAETRAQVGEWHVEWQRARNLQVLYRSTVLPQARATVTASLAAYRVGRINLMTVLDDQMTVNRYEQELAVLEAAEGMALAELEMLLGRELFDPHSSRPSSGGNR